MSSEVVPRPSDRFIPWIFVAAFALLVVIDGFLVYIAVSTQTGVVTEQAYEHGLAYNGYLAEDEAQKARGWAGEVKLEESGQLAFFLKGREGEPLEGAQVEAHIMRPAVAGQDFAVQLTETAPGRYEATPQFPTHGLWEVRISATWQNQPFRISRDVITP
jgi:nitrogen fixation protein FixH